MRWAAVKHALGMAAVVAGTGLPVVAQSPPPFPVTLQKQLAERASNYTEVSLDKKMLAFASRFMNDSDSDQAQSKRIISKLNGVYVRSYEFDKPGQYTAADLDSIRRQFNTSEWEPMVKTRSRDGSDDADIYMKMVNGDVQGMFILDAESKELDFVFISGAIEPEDLKDLSGNFGIPSDAYAMSTKAKNKAQGAVPSKSDKAQKEGQP